MIIISPKILLIQRHLILRLSCYLVRITINFENLKTNKSKPVRWSREERTRSHDYICHELDRLWLLLTTTWHTSVSLDKCIAVYSRHLRVDALHSDTTERGTFAWVPVIARHEMRSSIIKKWGRHSHYTHLITVIVIRPQQRSDVHKVFQYRLMRRDTKNACRWDVSSHQRSKLT